LSCLSNKCAIHCCVAFTAFDVDAGEFLVDFRPKACISCLSALLESDDAFA